MRLGFGGESLLLPEIVSSRTLLEQPVSDLVAILSGVQWLRWRAISSAETLSTPDEDSPFRRSEIPTPEVHEWASLTSDAVEPSAAFWGVFGATEAEAKE